MTDEQVAYIVRNWNPAQDTWQGDIGWTSPQGEDIYSYPPPSGIVPAIDRKKWRELPPGMADEARAYVRCITSRYPLQLRAMLGIPMWLRFCDVWSDSGNIVLAMRAI